MTVRSYVDNVEYQRHSVHFFCMCSNKLWLCALVDNVEYQRHSVHLFCVCSNKLWLCALTLIMWSIITAMPMMKWAKLLGCVCVCVCVCVCMRAHINWLLITPLHNNVCQRVPLSFLVAKQPATLVRTMSPAGVLSLCAMNIKMKAHTPTRREVSIRARCVSDTPHYQHKSAQS